VAEQETKTSERKQKPGWEPGEWKKLAKEEQDAYHAKWERQQERRLAKQKLRASVFLDEFGIVGVFAAHLELSLETMSPPEAFEAAQHATRHHLKSYSFIPVSAKGVQTEYRMVRRGQQAKGGEAMR